MKKICFFGIYDKEYPRNKVLLQGFKENGYEITHVNVDPRAHTGWKKYLVLYREGKKVQKEEFEMVWVAFPGHTCVWLAKILFPKNLLVFDVFISQYEANVSDRKVHAPGSFKALKDWFLDWHSIRVADIVTIDTKEQIKLFQRNYGLNLKKAVRIFLSSALPVQEDIRRITGNRFLIHFHGSFIPLHGVEHVVRAAKLLEGEKDISFRLVGGGQQLAEMKELANSLYLKNVEFTGRVAEYSDVLAYLKDSDIMLGMFAVSGRGHCVITNKIFEGMTYGKPIVSADVPAMHELFTDKENILFCIPGDPKDIAAKILELRDDPALREKIGRNAQELFKQRLSPYALVKEFLSELPKHL